MIGVFGANGFIGRHATLSLARAGHRVLAVSRSAPATVDHPGVECVVADFTDRQARRALLARVDTVVQLIATSSPASGNSFTSSDMAENVLPHADFIAQCAQAGVRRFVFMSSGGTVYGPTEGLTAVTEAVATNPICSHGLTKLTVEKILGMHGHADDLDYVVLRVANAFGPGQILKRGQGLIPAVLSRHYAGEPVTIMGDGSATRDYVYVEDVSRAVVDAVELSGHRAEVLNIGTGVATSVNEVIDAIQSELGVTLDVERVPGRATDVRGIALDVKRAREVMGWWPRTSFGEGIRRTVDWWRAVPTPREGQLPQRSVSGAHL